MVGFFETKSFWQGGFTEEHQKYYEEHHLSQKGKHLWEQINRLYIIARSVCPYKANQDRKKKDTKGQNLNRDTEPRPNGTKAPRRRPQESNDAARRRR
jgi:hypothetical protein